LPENAALSFGPTDNAQFGAHRRWALEFAGVTDESGHLATAFVLASIEARPVDAPAVAPEKEPAVTAMMSLEEPFQIGINCVGRYPAGVLPPGAEAGAPGWRQKFWNPASQDTAAYLMDSRGRVSPVSFTTSVWYMNPHFTDIPTPDHQLLAGWCRSVHAPNSISGLKPGTKYTVGLYLFAPGKQGTTAKRRITFTSDDKGKPPLTRDVEVATAPTFTGYDGIFFEFEEVPANRTGAIQFSVSEPVEVKGQTKWEPSRVSAVQIRSK
jgi:hypothetical protein